MLVGYQFILRWTNAHAMWVKRGSPLSARILDTLMTMPLNHPRLKEDVIEKVGPPFCQYHEQWLGPLSPCAAGLEACCCMAIARGVAGDCGSWYSTNSIDSPWLGYSLPVCQLAVHCPCSVVGCP